MTSESQLNDAVNKQVGYETSSSGVFLKVESEAATIGSNAAIATELDVERLALPNVLRASLGNATPCSSTSSNGSSTPTVKRRNRPHVHFIWQFVRIDDDRNVFCNVCGQKIASPGVTNVRSHLTRRHPEQFGYLAEAYSSEQEKKNQISSLSTSESLLLDLYNSAAMNSPECASLSPTASNVATVSPQCVGRQIASNANPVVVQSTTPVSEREIVEPTLPPLPNPQILRIPNPSNNMAVQCVGFDRALVEKIGERNGIIIQIGPMSSSRLEESSFYKVGDAVLLPEEGGVKVATGGKELVIIKVTEIDGKLAPLMSASFLPRTS